MTVPESTRQWFASINRSVFVVTVAAGGRVNALTMTQVMRASYGRDPWLLLSVGKENFSHGLFAAASAVTVHFVTADEPAATLAERMGSSSGHHTDKLAGVSWEPGPGGAPLLADLPYRAAIHLRQAWDALTHTVYAGSVLWAQPPRMPLLDVAGLMRRPAMAALPPVWDREGL